MRSEIVFIMHPSDEVEFANFILSEPGTIFVDGPKWQESVPATITELQDSGTYLMIWNRIEAPNLSGRRHQKAGSEWWYCENEFLTIQFLRSGFQFDEPYLFEGRIAVSTTSKTKLFFHEPSSHPVEERFKRLRKTIKHTYKNRLIVWQNSLCPRSSTNPLRAAANVWVGPHALKWLEADPEGRWVQQFRGAGAKGYLLDLVK